MMWLVGVLLFWNVFTSAVLIGVLFKVRTLEDRVAALWNGGM